MKRAWTCLLLAAALMAGVLLLVACGGEKKEEAKETPAATEAAAPAEAETEEAVVEEEKPTPSPTPSGVIRLSQDAAAEYALLEVITGDYRLASGTTLYEGSTVDLSSEEYLTFPPGLAIVIGEGGVTLKGQFYPEGSQLQVGENGDIPPDEEAEEEEAEEAEFAPSALEGLDSYRYKVEISIEGLGEEVEGLEGPFGMSQEGAFVAPDSHQAKCSFEMGPLSMEEEVISIGSETWVKGAESTSFEKAEPTFCTGDFTPAELASSLSSEDIRKLKGEKEEVNGVDAVHYSLDEAALEELLGLAEALGAEDVEQLPENLTFDIDIWLAEDGGWPVKLLFDFSGEQDGQQISFNLEADVTDVNDADIKIEAP